MAAALIREAASGDLSGICAKLALLAPGLTIVLSMRWALLISALLLTGCASAPPESAKTSALPTDYEPSQASALAFDTPMAPPYPLLGLAREPREIGAFAGFQDSVTEFFAVSTDDYQSNNPWSNSYDRESISVKVGTRTR